MVNGIKKFRKRSTQWVYFVVNSLCNSFYRRESGWVGTQRSGGISPNIGYVGAVYRYIRGRSGAFPPFCEGSLGAVGSVT